MELNRLIQLDSSDYTHRDRINGVQDGVLRLLSENLIEISKLLKRDYTTLIFKKVITNSQLERIEIEYGFVVNMETSNTEYKIDIFKLVIENENFETNAAVSKIKISRYYKPIVTNSKNNQSLACFFKILFCTNLVAFNEICEEHEHLFFNYEWRCGGNYKLIEDFALNFHTKY